MFRRCVRPGNPVPASRNIIPNPAIRDDDGTGGNIPSSAKSAEFSEIRRPYSRFAAFLKPVPHWDAGKSAGFYPNMTDIRTGRNGR